MLLEGGQSDRAGHVFETPGLSTVLTESSRPTQIRQECILCVFQSQVYDKMYQQEPPLTALHGNRYALFRSKYEVAQCLRMTSVAMCSCQLFRTERTGKVILWRKSHVKVILCLYCEMTNWLLTVGHFRYFCVFRLLRAPLLTKEIFTGATMKGKVFRNVTPCSLVNWCKFFGGTCSL